MPRFIAPRHDGRVLSGPFAGLKYIQAASGSALMPKVLGTYEKELWGIVQRIIELEPQLVIDIGAAEGYYVAGLSMKLPSTAFVAFEQNPQAREKQQELFTLNGISGSVEAHGSCTPDALEAALSASDHAPRRVVICDVEGYEKTLLDPALVPGLTASWMLVELHDHLTDGVTETLVARFEATHEIELIDSAVRTAEDYPFHAWWAKVMPKRYGLFPLSELRPVPMQWAWMTPRHPRHPRHPGNQEQTH